MKILIASDTYKPTINGVVTSILNLKAGLEALGAEVRVLTLSASNKSYTEDGVYYIDSIDMGRIYPEGRMRKRRGKKELEAIMAWNPDIVHSQSEFSIYPLARKIVRKLSIPMIHTYHTIYEDYTHYFAPQKTIGKKAVAALSRRIGNHSTEMIVPTKKVGDILNEYKVSCPISVIPTGISLSKYQEFVSENELLDLRRGWGLIKDHLVLVSISRVCKEKNIQELIHYINDLDNNKVRLLIVGDGPERLALENLTEELGLSEKVIFTGMIAPEMVPSYYKMADIFVSASTSETQGLTYIEAMASGTPILCREDDSLNNVLLEGDNGYSFSDKSSFIEKMEAISNQNVDKKMSLAAIEKSRDYSRITFASRVYDLYRKNIRLNSENILKDEKRKTDRDIMHVLSGVLMLLMTMMAIIGYQKGYFTSISELQTLVTSFGIMAPLIFVLLQILQVVFPIIPGGLGCLAGVILFGPLWGFVYNYIGIVAGSLIVFGISKVYGKSVVSRVFPRSMTIKYFRWVEKKDTYKKWFAAAIFFPIAPDDLLCYIAGTTKMKWKEFTTIIVLGKPASIALYSLGLSTVFNGVLSL